MMRLWPSGALVIATVLLTCWVAVGHAALYERPKERPPLPSPMGYVSDHAQVLNEDWKARIRSVCQDLERKTGIEMVVVTVSTIKPFSSAHEYALRCTKSGASALRNRSMA